MIFFDIHIEDLLVSFFSETQSHFSDLEKANVFLKTTCGINNFFSTKDELSGLKLKINEQSTLVSEPNRREYGDFQTNDHLALEVVRYAWRKEKDYEFVLEPTCGKGNFVMAVLKTFTSVKKIVGIEIYKPYIWETKFKILKYFVENAGRKIPEIDIVHANTFNFPFPELSKQTLRHKTLIIGNPPWVTNSELGSMDSKNLPQKLNFKNHSGMDAMTGKGNFDIGEYISNLLLKNFHGHNGAFAFLIKNAVAKNIIHDQHRNRYQFCRSEKLNIDAKKEFNVSVDACLFYTQLGLTPDYTCVEKDFYTGALKTVFGWHKSKFVNSIDHYKNTMIFDGKSQFVWRQGIKHDCAKVMELEKQDLHFINGLKQQVEIEKELVYGLLKSSDLKEKITNKYRKSTIVTQRKIGQETDYIRREFPLTFNYLENNAAVFEKRKSSIYDGKPKFSIFGVGEYAFKPFKVAISGMYKTTHFTLVLPEKLKPIMLDDTCYFIGFDNLEFATITHFLLNGKIAQELLKALIFSDSKRSITKDVLMRVDLLGLYQSTNFSMVKEVITNLSFETWEQFGKTLLNKTATKQKTLF